MKYLKGKINGKTAYQCYGMGDDICAGCWAKGIWRQAWVIFRYKTVPSDDAPCYCSACIREVLAGTMKEAKSMDEEEDLILPDDSNYFEQERGFYK